MATAAYRTVAAAVDPDADVLEAVELTHPAADAPIRLVNDGRNHTIDGQPYTGLRMALVWPDQSEDRRPGARLSCDNVGRVLTRWIEGTGGLVGGRVRFIHALAATGAIEASVTMDVAGASVDADVVSVQLGYGLSLTDRAVALRHTPTTSPGLF